MPVLVALWSFITSLPIWLISVISALTLALTDIGRDVMVWFFSQTMDLIIYILGSIPVPSTAFDASQYWGMLPSGIVQTFSYLGGVEALGIVVSALTVRLLLGLIPFVRIGG